MSAETLLWERARSVFDDLLNTAPDGRGAAIAAACGEDRELQRAVEALLDHDRDDSFLERPPEAFGAAAAGVDPALRWQGRRLGPYRLLEPIGRGGSGIVFAAERGGDFEQRAAIKVLSAALDAGARRRFHAERQILARLEHPNIARLIDGGTTEDGFPYVVMELVEGLPITEHCDRRELSIEGRLALFRQVCEAVRHAHRHLIVHRDLKPSNILVGSCGRVRLLDFGIAKLLGEPGSDIPTTRSRRLTPAYASPEQLLGRPVTTLSDVYSLGLLLFELLTGERPFRDSGHDLAAVADRPPVRPPSATFGGGNGRANPESRRGRAARRGSTPRRLVGHLRGDLDAIVLRSLRDEPEARYGDVNAFVRDLDRHRERLPVNARNGEAIYRARRFVRRHPAWLSAIGLTVTASLALAAVSTRHAAELRQERDAAEEARLEAESVTAAIEEVLEIMKPLPDRGYREPVRSVLERAAGRVRERFAEQPRRRARLLSALAGVQTTLGDFEAAEGLRREALAALRPAQGAFSRRQAAELRRLGDLIVERGRVGEGRALIRTAHALVSAVEGPQDRMEVVRSLATLGELASEEGDLGRARELLERSLAMAERLGRSGTRDQADRMSSLAVVLTDIGDFDGARALLEEALEIVGRGTPRSRTYAAFINNLATLGWHQGRLHEALELLREALGIFSDLQGEDSEEVRDVRANLGVALYATGQLEEAEAVYRETLASELRSAGRNTPDVASLSSNLGLLLREQGRLDEAADYLRQALEINRKTLGDDHPSVAVNVNNLGLVELDRGRFSEAERLFQKALAINRQKLGPDHHLTGTNHVNLAKAALAAGNLALARQRAETAGAILAAAFPEGHWRRAVADSVRGAVLVRLGAREEGLALLEASHAAILEAKGADGFYTREAAARLAEAQAGG